MVYRGSLTGPVFGLRREIDRLFEDAFGGDSRRSGAWTPAVDIREDNKEIVLEVELPGIKPSEVEVTAENGVLTIRGEKQSTSTEGGEGRYHVIERTFGSFTRSFQLPSGVDERRIEADFTDGLLNVRIPKAALAQPRRIEIRNSGSQPAIQGTPEGSTGSRGKQQSQGSARGGAGTHGAGASQGSGETRNQNTTAGSGQNTPSGG
jgi:HSP20 family protein